MQKTKLHYGAFTVVFALNVSANDLQQELRLLKEQLALLQNKVIALEKLIEKSPESVGSINQLSKPVKTTKSMVKSETEINKDIKLYASLRPTIGHIDENSESAWDVRDALSNAGFKSTFQFKENWTAILHGEWSIDLSNNANFGKARQVYVAVDTPYGKVGIGKQRPVQYLFIAEYSDIFDHSNSPFAYDTESPFFVDNMVTYQLKSGDFTWMLASQFDGEEGIITVTSLMAV